MKTETKTVEIPKYTTNIMHKYFKYIYNMCVRCIRAVMNRPVDFGFRPNLRPNLKAKLRPDY